MEPRPLIVDIKRGSLEDGPGIRSVVFFKGCPLRCVFCHNPETQETGLELAFTSSRCLRCRRCADLCAQHAIDLDGDPRIDRMRCDLCGRCAAECPSLALRIIGKFWPAETLAGALLRDLPFYRASSGGVTLSGGEATLFPGYVHELCLLLKAEHVHIVLETCGFFDYGAFSREILPFLDLVLFDLKLIDPQASLRHFGRSNDLILRNLKRLLKERSVPVRPRIPLVPGITDDDQNLSRIVELLCELGSSDVCLVPYNPLGLAMYGCLGRPAPKLPAAFTRPEREREIVEKFRQAICHAGQAHSAVT